MASLTPRDDGLTMPAEWSAHERTLMAWPTRARGAAADLEQARHDHAEVARAIAAFEPVLVLASPGDAADVRDRCGQGVEVVEIPLDDAWLRDSGPIFVLGRHGQRGAADFRFNGWGRRAEAFERDAQVGERLCAALSIARYPVPMVLEGGAITVDGRGTLIATEQCLLDPARNPKLDREEVERRLRAYLGIERIIWLARGLAEDGRVAGHLGDVCTFVGPGRVLLQGVSDASSPAHAVVEENRGRLEAALDVNGHHLEVVELDLLPVAEVGGESRPVSYLDLHQVNGAVIVPVAGLDPDMDAEALRRIGEACDGREAIGVPGLTLALAGGGVRRMTQPLPAPVE